MAKGIRSYGPGKFNDIIDGYAYELTLDGGADEEVSFGDGGEWYGFMKIDQSFADAIHKVAKENKDELTDEEQDLLDESKVVILHSRSDGIVEATWHDDLKEAEQDWAIIEAEAGDDEDDDEEDDFDLESEMEDALIVGDARGNRYSLSFSGKHIGDFGDFDEALAAGIEEMHRSNYFPNIFYVNERGNTDLLTVKYTLEDGKPVNIEDTIVRSWT